MLFDCLVDLVCGLDWCGLGFWVVFIVCELLVRWLLVDLLSWWLLVFVYFKRGTLGFDWFCVLLCVWIVDVVITFVGWFCFVWYVLVVDWALVWVDLILVVLIVSYLLTWCFVSGFVCGVLRIGWCCCLFWFGILVVCLISLLFIVLVNFGFDAVFVCCF